MIKYHCNKPQLVLAPAGLTLNADVDMIHLILKLAILRASEAANTVVHYM